MVSQRMSTARIEANAVSTARELDSVSSPVPRGIFLTAAWAGRTSGRLSRAYECKDWLMNALIGPSGAFGRGGAESSAADPVLVAGSAMEE